MSLLVNVNSIPHIRCTCKTLFKVTRHNLFASNFDSLTEYIISARCPACRMFHTYHDCVGFFNEYFFIIDPISKYQFKNNEEAFNYFLHYRSFLKELESSVMV